jgi:hypothetical protein
VLVGFCELNGWEKLQSDRDVMKNRPLLGAVFFNPVIDFALYYLISAQCTDFSFRHVISVPSSKCGIRVFACHGELAAVQYRVGVGAAVRSNRGGRAGPRVPKSKISLLASLHIYQHGL